VRRKESGQQALLEAYQNYTTTISGLHQDACRRLQEQYGTLMSKIGEARQSAAKLARQQQYVDYLKSVQRVWSAVDMGALVPKYSHD